MLLPPSAPAWTILGVWISVKPWAVRYSRKARLIPSCTLKTERVRRLRSTRGLRDSSVSRFSLSRRLETATGMGAAGRDSTRTSSAASSRPPGARSSRRTVPVTTAAHSSHSPSGSSSGRHTHWTAPSRTRRARKVIPPMARRLWTAPFRVTACPSSAPPAISPNPRGTCFVSVTYFMLISSFPDRSFRRNAKIPGRI